MWAQRVTEGTKGGQAHAHYNDHHVNRDHSEESSHSHKNKKRGSTTRQPADNGMQIDHNAQSDETLLY